MSITIAAAPGFSTMFLAGKYLIGPRFGNASSFFGTSLLEIVNNGPGDATSVEITIGAGEMSLYGPVSHISIPPGGTVPIGVKFARTGGMVLTPAHSVVTVRWAGQPAGTTTIGLVCTVSNAAASILFLPSVLQLVASTTAKSINSSLQCQQAVTDFQGTALPAGSAFSQNTPAGSFVALGLTPPKLTLTFDSNPALQRTPQVFTVTASGPEGRQVVPFICWVADTLSPGQIRVVTIDADPPGPDLPNESITLQNTTNQTLSTDGCYLRDEGGNGRSFVFPAGFTLNAGASVVIHSGRGQNSPTDLFWGLSQPVWDNDYDSAVVFNFAGDEITRYFYVIALPGVRIQGQTNIFDAMIFVDQRLPFTPTGMVLEDGDFVALEPNPNQLSFSGDVTRGATGPAGAPVDAPDPGWPAPGAPMFALLADAGTTVVVGGNTFSQVVNRTSGLRPAYPLSLLINDDQPGGPFSWGGYLVRLRIWRN